MDENTRAQLTVSEDRQEVRLQFDRNDLGIDDALQAIQEQMEKMGLAAATVNELWEDRVRDALTDAESLEDFLLVEGQPPVPPVPGYIEWGGDYFSEGFVVDPETGAADYRERKAQPVVMAGELLARIVPPVSGTDGVDVYGNTIPTGKTEWPRLRAGRNVAFDENEYTYVAASSGRVRLNGYFLVIDELMTIPGSVGLGTGNIRHPGALDVGTDIEAGSRVHTDGHINVGGYIESSDVRAGGNLTVRGGITGHGREAIQAGGSLHARYLNETTVVVEGDVEIDNEILNSRVYSRGAVNIPRGRIIGGVVEAKLAIEVRDAGSPGGVRTELAAGWSADELRAIVQQRRKIQDLEEKIREIHVTVEPLLKKMGELPADKRDTITQLLSKAYELEHVTAGEKQTLEEMTGGKEPAIIVRGKLHPDTVLKINEQRLILRQEVEGPIRAIAGPDRIKLLQAQSRAGMERGE